MKRFIFITILIISLYDVSAQIRIESVGPPQPVKLTQKEIYDSAKVTVFYDYGCVEPTFNGPNVRKYSEVILLIGEKYIGTMDWRNYEVDSIQDDFYWNKRGNSDDLANYIVNDERFHPAYRFPVVVNMDSQEATLYIQSFSGSYKYNQQLPKIEWKLENEEKKIKGIRCLKATCRFGGRDWTAWYAPEYAMPYGPYLFNGLPGLIMQVVDTKKNFAFKFKGIEFWEPGRCIYLIQLDNMIVTTRDKAREAIRNFCKDPNGAVKAIDENFGKSLLSTIKVSLPYNPIELE